MTGGSPAAPASRALGAVPPALFVAALLLATVNLRIPLVAVAPVAGDIRSDLGLSAAEVGLLTSVPVLCFGLAAPVALLVARRIGPELALLTCLAGTIAGTLIRSSGPFWVAIAGTVVIGIAITVGNIVVPVLIRRDVRPARVGMVTGAYTSTLNVGAMAVSVGTAPLAALLGWRWALAAWAGLALVGAIAWTLFLRRQGRIERSEPIAVNSRSVWRRPLAWLLALAFAAQATSYYAITAWLPSLLADEQGLSAAEAGGASSLFQIFAVVGALSAPLLALRLPAWAPVALIGMLWITLPIGLLAAPEYFLLFSVIGGIAQGGGITAIFTVIAGAAGSSRQAGALSAFVQGFGYLVAALGPPALGLAHDVTGGWTVPLLLALGTTIGFLVFGVAAAVHASRVRASELRAGAPTDAVGAG